MPGSPEAPHWPTEAELERKARLAARDEELRQTKVMANLIIDEMNKYLKAIQDEIFPDHVRRFKGDIPRIQVPALQK